MNPPYRMNPPYHECPLGGKPPEIKACRMKALWGEYPWDESLAWISYGMKHRR